MVLVALETVFANHIYQCENDLYRQRTGGGIGARITGVVARVVMDIWADKVHNVLAENQVIIYLLAKYVDDINIATSVMEPGAVWKMEDRKWRLAQDSAQK